MDPQALAQAMRGMSPQQTQAATGMVSQMLLQDRQHAHEGQKMQEQHMFQAMQNELSRNVKQAKLELDQAKGDAYIESQTSGAALDRQRLGDLQFQSRLLDRFQQIPVDTNMGSMSLLEAHTARSSGLNVSILGDPEDWDREMIEFLNPQGQIDMKLVSINKTTGEMQISESLGQAVPSGSVRYLRNEDTGQTIGLIPGQEIPEGNWVDVPKINLEGQYGPRDRSEQSRIGMLRGDVTGPEWASKIIQSLDFNTQFQLELPSPGSKRYQEAQFAAREKARMDLENMWKEQGFTVEVILAEDTNTGRIGYYAVFPDGTTEFIRGDLFHE